MSSIDSQAIDPDPFLLVALCLQGAAVALQLVQVSQQANRPRSSHGAVVNRATALEHLENALTTLETAIAQCERRVRRLSPSPDKELYEAKFRISVGILTLEARGVREYHNDLAELTTRLSGLTRWIGHIIGQDPDIAAALGSDISATIGNSAERLNALLSSGAANEAVLSEAKIVRDALRASLVRHLDDSGN